MKRLLDFGDRYAKQSTWKDYTLVKFCLFSMGLIAGTAIPGMHKKKAVCAASCVFLLTYIPLMSNVFRLAFKKEEEDEEDESFESSETCA